MKQSKKRLAIAIQTYIILTVIFAGCQALETYTTPSSTAAATGTTSSSQDSIAYIFFKVWFEALLTKTFVAAILLTFIYTPLFATAAYLIGILLGILLSLVAGKEIDTIPAIVMKIIAAFMLFFVGFHSFLYLYESKEDAPEDKGHEEAKKDNKKGKKNDEESEDLLKTHKFVEKKAQEHIVEKYTKDLQKGDEKKEEEKEEPKEGCCGTLFSIKFLSKTPLRFISAFLMFFFVSMTEPVFNTIWTLRQTDSFLSIFIACLVVYAVNCGLIILFGWLIKHKLLKDVLTKDNAKIFRGIGCAILIFLSFVTIF